MHPALMFLAMVAFMGIPAGGLVWINMSQGDEDDGIAIAVGLSVAVFSGLILVGIIFLNDWLVKTGLIEVGN